MRVFEYTMEYRGYSCPEYCQVDHSHIKDCDGQEVSNVIMEGAEGSL